MQARRRGYRATCIMARLSPSTFARVPELAKSLSFFKIRIPKKYPCTLDYISKFVLETAGEQNAAAKSRVAKT